MRLSEIICQSGTPKDISVNTSEKFKHIITSNIIAINLSLIKPLNYQLDTKSMGKCTILKNNDVNSKNQRMPNDLSI